MDNLTRLLPLFARTPEDAELNFQVACHYESIGQTATALTYFLRCAERTGNKNLAYECMLKIGLCFHRQGGRKNSVRGAFKHALMIIPTRPEAYFLLARHYETLGDHPMGYMMAELGLQFADNNQVPLRTNVEYPGYYGLIFQKMVCSWWWGKPQECRNLLQVLKNEYASQMDAAHWEATQANLSRLGSGPSSQAHLPYLAKDYDRLRFKFDGSEKIVRNYAQVYQDLFVLSMTNGKTKGTYLEIGSAEPEFGNNTKLLESVFGWVGVGIDYDEKLVTQYRAARVNKVIHANALEVDYDDILSKLAVDGVVDYLQLDCEPSGVTYNAMTRIPWDKYKFAVITYEHDDYVDMTKQYKWKSREYLTSRGYVLVATDISPDGQCNFEDWYVHPDLVDKEIIAKMKSTPKMTQHAAEYMLPELV